MQEKDKNTLYCSFCGQSQKEVKKLIAGPTVFICDQCVGLCQEIITAETHAVPQDLAAKLSFPLIMSERLPVLVSNLTMNGSPIKGSYVLECIGAVDNPEMTVTELLQGISGFLERHCVATCRSDVRDLLDETIKEISRVTDSFKDMDPEHITESRGLQCLNRLAELRDRQAMLETYLEKTK